MGFLSSLFGEPKPVPPPTVVIKNVLGETLLEVPLRDLVGSTCLRGKDLSHAFLQGQWLDGADLENVNLFGADLRNCSFARCSLKNANLAYALIAGAQFDHANLEGADLGNAIGVQRASFRNALLSQETTIPGRRVTGTVRVVA
jgi:uncharacterized protein YjbI with pentapeptide repeats